MLMQIPALSLVMQSGAMADVEYLGINKSGKIAMLKASDWVESKHPRAENGQFGSGGSSGSGQRRESPGAKHKRNQQARRAEQTAQTTLGGNKAIQSLLSGGSALDKIGWLNTSKPKEPEKKPNAEKPAPKKPDPSKVGVVYLDDATPDSWKIDRKATLEMIKDGTISASALGFAIDRHKVVIDDTRKQLDKMLSDRGKTKASVIRASPEFVKLATKRDQMKSDLGEMYDMMKVAAHHTRTRGSENIILS